MRVLAACVLMLCIPVACAGQQAPTGVTSPSPAASPAGWTLVFSDEFDGPGALDPAKWGYETGYIRNKEAQFYTARIENVRAEDGMLVIEARKEPYQSFAYTSASINTSGRFEFLYGRVEVRAKLPTGVGTWPAAWMLGVNRKEVGWPACGEIDIMENVGFDPLRIVGSVHTAAYNHTIGTHKSASVAIANPWEGFHVYAMEWFADRIDIFVDGQKVLHVPERGDWFADLALRQAAVPPDQPGDRRIVGRAERDRRHALSPSIRRRLRANLPAAVTPG